MTSLIRFSDNPQQKETIDSIIWLIWHLVEIFGEIAETRQISNLRNQDVSTEILSNLVRTYVAEFSDKFSHFQYATMEMFKATLNNY